MRFTFLTPGTGYFLCGSCLRDNTLASALRRGGHAADVVPLYLPHVLEDAAPEQPVHMGGINMYLQQKTRLARFLPAFLSRQLDRPGLLRRVSRWGNMTDAPDLGAMTVSMLKGEHGRQQKEVEKLVAWLVQAPRPDALVISNAMLCGVVRRIREMLDVPIVVTLQGEAPFLDALPSPYREQAWDELRGLATRVDAFVAVSRWHGELMARRLGLAAGAVSVVYNGIDARDFAAEPVPLAERLPPTIGYLARMCRDKGVHTLVDAFLRLVARARVPPNVRLCIVGAQLNEDRRFVSTLQSRVRAAGLADRVEFHPNVDRDAKVAHLRTFSVLSVPATYGESFGLYVPEALAAGVPVVQPDHAAFPELLAATGGGVLCAPDDVEALAESLEALLLDPQRAQSLADAGRRAVLERFVAERMAEEFAGVCKILGPRDSSNSNTAP